MQEKSNTPKNSFDLSDYMPYYLLKRIWIQLTVISLMFLLCATIFTYFQDVDWLTALLMSVSTLTTVGLYIPDLDSLPAAEKALLIVVILGAVSAAASLLQSMIANVTALVVEGELSQSFRRRKMEKTAFNSNDHYIICGLSDAGYYIVDELHSTKRPHVVIDLNKEKLEKTLDPFRDEVFIVGDASDSEILQKAGIEKATGLFAVTGDDNENLVISLTAKQLNPQLRVIARCKEVRNSEKIKKAGADAVISPGYIGGLRMASEMIRPTVVSFLDVMLRDRQKNLRVEEVSLPASVVGKTVSALNLKKYEHTMLLALKTKEGWIYNPHDDHVIQTDNTLIVITNPEERAELEKLFRSLK